jgi:hypothetical protein
VCSRTIRHNNAGEYGETPANVHHKESASEPLIFGKSYVGHNAGAKQNEQGGSYDLRNEYSSDIVHENPSDSTGMPKLSLYGERMKIT